MESCRKHIFGQTISFRFGETAFAENAAEEIDLYPDSNKNSSDITIEIDTQGPEATLLSVNPPLHVETDSGFKISSGPVDISWDFSKLEPRIVLSSKVKRSFLASYPKKFLSMGYVSPHEASGQILHELVLVPLTYFLQDIAPIHCSAFTRNGKAFLLGGTRGVGKTSALLNLCSTMCIEFLADDMTIVSEEGFAYPNLAYPKIYAFSTEGNKTLESLLLAKENCPGKFQWSVLKRINPSRVRRRISPARLYRLPETKKYPIGTCFLLFRDNSRCVETEEIDADFMRKLTLSVIKAEYHVINNHIYWHEYNRKAAGKDPLFDLDTIFERWSEIYMKTFSKSRLAIIHIPMDLDHETCKKKLLEILKDTTR